MGFDLSTKAAKLLTGAKMWATKNEPALWFVGGILTMGGAIAYTIASSTKATAILEEHRQYMKDVEACKEVSKANPKKYDYTQKDERNDKIQFYVQTGIKYARLYAPTLLMTAGSIFCFAKGFGVLKGWADGAMTLAAGYASTLNRVKERVIEEEGEEKWNYYVNGVKPPGEVKCIELDENGNETIVPVDGAHKVTDQTETKPFAFWFDEACPGFDSNEDYNIRYLREKEDVLNTLCWKRGAITYNDILDEFGLPRIPLGQCYGIVDDGSGHAVSLGVDDFILKPSKDGKYYSPGFLIQPNVDVSCYVWEAYKGPHEALSRVASGAA